MSWAAILLALAPAVGNASVADRFAIRADPTVAAQVNAVLRRLAEPVLTRVPVGRDPASLLREACGGLVRPEIRSIRTAPGAGFATVRHLPCIRFRISREIAVEPGHRLEMLAAALGLRRSSSITAMVRRNTPGAVWARIDPRRLKIGDIVRFPQAPVWTDIRIGPSAGGRAGLISAFARALGCPSGDDAACVNARGVTLLDREPLRTRPGGGKAFPFPNEAELSDTLAIQPFELVGGTQIAAAASETAAVAALTVMAAPPDLPSPQVPDEQWPYDPDLLAATLSDVAAQARPVAIGVADAGLRDSGGSPIPASAFASDRGTGVRREQDLDRTDDLGICASQQPQFNPGTEERQHADHGPIVASIATGLPVRARVSNPSAFPQLVFFRLVDDLCRVPPVADVSEGALKEAMDYFFEHENPPVPIAVASFFRTGRTTLDFENAVNAHLQAFDDLLVLPAGNDFIGNLDDDKPCPPCLAHSGWGNNTARSSQRIMVVGVADKGLSVANGTNWGLNTVFIYAPGETAGAFDISGASASYSPATSWAAPRVAFAAGVMRSLGIQRIRDLRERMNAATWPIGSSGGKVDPAKTGVLNLMKAAAVRHYALEVIRPANGGIERRTYVGRLVTPVESLCAEFELSPRSIHSIRFESGAGRSREFAARSRIPDSASGQFRTLRGTCTMPPQIRFNDLNAGVLEIDIASIVHILLPWIEPS